MALAKTLVARVRAPWVTHPLSRIRILNVLKQRRRQYGSGQARRGYLEPCAFLFLCAQVAVMLANLPQQEQSEQELPRIQRIRELVRQANLEVVYQRGRELARQADTEVANYI